ncbi:MAG TPA: hypothetical protein VM821_06735, partial [Abditibacteriaceae bacterium]|nr:hypothetical protein [Abditibacteriaceae bacterium]
GNPRPVQGQAENETRSESFDKPGSASFRVGCCCFWKRNGHAKGNFRGREMTIGGASRLQNPAYRRDLQTIVEERLTSDDYRVLDCFTLMSHFEFAPNRQ